MNDKKQYLERGSFVSILHFSSRAPFVEKCGYGIFWLGGRAFLRRRETVQKVKI
jgi:hypothetical protein